MRVVAGSARGRPLHGPKGDNIRPTSDRVRETLFNVIGPWLEGTVLDLYAGTGALAIESLSRGATRAVLVDSSRQGQQLCTRNLEELGFTPSAEVMPMPVARALDVLEKRGDRFDFIFADPPYAAKASSWLLERLARSSLLNSGGTLVIETDKWEEEPSSKEWVREDERSFGDTRVRLYRRTSPVPT
jgi:16S rRNA (guanine(966)-N(2))-methyltransferase RsmD